MFIFVNKRALVEIKYHRMKINIKNENLLPQTLILKIQQKLIQF